MYHEKHKQGSRTYHLYGIPPEIEDELLEYGHFLKQRTLRQAKRPHRQYDEQADYDGRR